MVSGKYKGPVEHNGIILLMTSLEHHRGVPEVVKDTNEKVRREVDTGF